MAFGSASFADDIGYETIARFQPKGAVASGDIPLLGSAKVRMCATKPIDISSRNQAELGIEMEMRVTRSDGKTGPGTLKLVRNGRIEIYDDTGAKVFEEDSPVQKGVKGERVAGEWMRVFYPLEKLGKNSGRLAMVRIFDYNDTPREAEQIVTETRNARIVDLKKPLSRAEPPEAEEAPAPEVSNRAFLKKTVAVENPDPLTTCNPLDLNYHIEPGKMRDGKLVDVEVSSADPAIVLYKGEYWLFASHGEGYWVSKDLAHWEYVFVDVTKPVLEQFKKWAPGTCVYNGTLYLTHSENGTMLKTTNPRDPSAWVEIGKVDGWADPAMFYDDPAQGGDGFVYIASGLSHRNPISVGRHDPKQDMKKIGHSYETAWPDMLNRGYEIPGHLNDNVKGNATQEGPWIAKHNGKYYLTCATPGTEYESYCDNLYRAESPLGPWVFCRNSPAIRKSTGFTRGAGHGALFEDLNGNWWKIDTCVVRGIARRLVLTPAWFDANDDLYTNTNFGDFPFYVPAKSKDPFHKPGPGWMLLSYGKKATASSNSTFAYLAFNECIADSWAAQTDQPGEWLQVDLGKVCGVHSVQVNFDDVEFKKGGRDNDFAYRYLMEFSQDGKTWKTLVDRTAQKVLRQNEYIEFKDVVGARFIRLTNKGPVPGFGKFAVSSLRVFGEGGGKPPAAVDPATVAFDRRQADSRRVAIEWGRAAGAEGYVIRYGVAPDRLHNQYQVFGARSLSYGFNSLNRGVDYYFTIDSFNENGVTRGVKVFKMSATDDILEGYDPGESNVVFKNRIANVPVYEAERAKLAGKGLKVEYQVRASGARAVLGIAPGAGTVEFSGVALAPGGGEAALRIGYSTLTGAKARIAVNGAAPVELALPETKGWGSYATIDLPLAGVKEKNSIRFESADGCFHLDSIQLFSK